MPDGENWFMTLFTVIINNYNYARFLDASIRSIVGQSYKDFDLIVVDDGSTDSSIAIATAYDEVRLVQTTRLGQARACLAALAHARGDYIYFLDADDEAHTDMLATMAEAVRDKPAKVQFQLEPIDGGGDVIGPAFPHYPDGYDSIAMQREIRRKGMCITPQTSGNVFARRVFEPIDDIAYENAIDGIPLLLAPFLGGVVSVSRPLGRYRLHGGNMSRDNSADRFRMERVRFKDRLDHLKRIMSVRDGAFELERPAEEMFYCVDKMMMEEFCKNGRISIQLLPKFLKALYREDDARRNVRLTLWVLAGLIGFKRLREVLLEVHANPWSDMKGIRGLVAALSSDDGAHSTDRSGG